MSREIISSVTGWCASPTGEKVPPQKIIIDRFTDGNQEVSCPLSQFPERKCEITLTKCIWEPKESILYRQRRSSTPGVK